jgi:hypothetical protein
MTIGGIPEEIQNDMKNYKTCNTITYYAGKNNPFWQCNLYLIFYGNNPNDNNNFINSPALFDTGTNQIIVPFDYLLSLKNTYFKNLFDKGICSFLKQGFDILNIICNYSFSDYVYNSLPDINLVFGDYDNYIINKNITTWAINLKPKDLFYLYGNTLVFAFKSSNKLNQWIIGQPLLKRFHMVFDKDNEKIGFYGGPIATTNVPNYNNYRIIWIALFLVSAILLIIMFGYLISKFRRRLPRNYIFSYSQPLSMNNNVL